MTNTLSHQILQNAIDSIRVQSESLELMSRMLSDSYVESKQRHKVASERRGLSALFDGQFFYKTKANKRSQKIGWRPEYNPAIINPVWRKKLDDDFDERHRRRRG